MARSVSVVKDIFDKDIVVINDIVFKGKRKIKWKDVKQYLEKYVGEIYNILSTGEVVFIGKDFPDEYTGSKYTYKIKGTVAKAKANAAQGLPELIYIASNKKYRANDKEKHRKDAALGWYRYESRFALPIYNEDEEVERYNIFHVALIMRHSYDNKVYLYDIIDIKKETGNPLQSKTLPGTKPISNKDNVKS